MVKDKCVQYLFRVLKRLPIPLLISAQTSLESFLKANYFLVEENREKAVEIATYLNGVLDMADINGYIVNEYLGDTLNTVD